MSEPGSVQYTPEQEADIEARINAAISENGINIESATNFIQKAGGRVFLDSKDLSEKITSTLERIDAEQIHDPTDFEKSVIKFLNKRNAIFYDRVDNKLQQAGLPREDNESTMDHLVRVITSLKDGKIEGVDPAEVEALKLKLSEAAKEREKSISELDALKNNILTNERDSLISQGIPGDLEYNAEELAVLLPGLKEQFYRAFQTEKDGEVWKVTDKSKNIPMLDSQGNYLSPDVVFGNFIGGMENLRRTTQQKGAGIPNGLTEEQRKGKESEWVAALDKNGWMGTEKPAQVLRKEMGLPISDRAKGFWPELKES